MPHVLDIESLGFSYPGRPPVCDGFEMHLEDGEIACLLGPSGCGKTTVLRCIAGLESIDAGRIVLHGQEVSRPGYTRAPEQRRVGVVFQDYALFPHLSVADNIAFGLRELRGRARDERVSELLAAVGLSAEAKKHPHELSGGQKQRVALARALAPRPQILLLDEPFSNLDVDLRERLSIEVRAILRHQRITALLVTHDQREAFAMSDMIGVMNHGRIEQDPGAADVDLDGVRRMLLHHRHVLVGRCVEHDGGRVLAHRGGPGSDAEPEGHSNRGSEVARWQAQ